MSCDLADGMDGGASELAGPLGDRVGHGKDLVALLVEQQVIVTKVLARHMPVKVLGL